MLNFVKFAKFCLNNVPKRRLAGPKNSILFPTYAFSYDGSIENSLQSDKILFSYKATVLRVKGF